LATQRSLPPPEAPPLRGSERTSHEGDTRDPTEQMTENASPQGWPDLRTMWCVPVHLPCNQLNWTEISSDLESSSPQPLPHSRTLYIFRLTSKADMRVRSDRCRPGARRRPESMKRPSPVESCRKEMNSALLGKTKIQDTIFRRP